MGSCCSCCCEEPPKPTPQKQKKPTVGVVLADVDNTLIHFEDRLVEQGYERIRANEGEDSDDDEEIYAKGDDNHQEENKKEEFTRETSIEKPASLEKEENKPSAEPAGTTTTPVTIQPDDENNENNNNENSSSTPNNKNKMNHRHEKFTHKWRHRITDTIIETYSLPFTFTKVIGEKSSASKTKQRPFISIKTLNSIKQLREQFGVKFCLYTNYDFATFLSRCDSAAFPKFDFGYCEGGAKLFADDSGIISKITNSSSSSSQQHQQDLDSVLPDLEWFQKFSSVFAKKNTDEEQKEVKPSALPVFKNQQLPSLDQRRGELWDCYRRLANKKPGSQVDLGENVSVNVEANERVGVSYLETAFTVHMYLVEKKDASSKSSSPLRKSRDDEKTAADNNNNDEEDNEDEDGNEKLQFFEGEIKLRQFIKNNYPLLSVSIFNKGRSAIVTPKGCTKSEAFEQLLLTHPELLLSKEALLLLSKNRNNNNINPFVQHYLKSIETETKILDKDLLEKEALLAKKQEELQNLMFKLEDSRQRVVQLEADIKYWRKVIADDNEIIEMEVNELDRLKSQILQPYLSARKQLLDNIEKLEQLVELRQKKLDDQNSNNYSDDMNNNEDIFPEQLMDILEGSRLALISKDEQLAENPKHNLRMSKRTWGGYLAFAGALTSEEFVDEIQNFTPENIPGPIQEKIFRLTDETPSFRSVDSGCSFSSASALAKWVMAIVDYFPKEENQIYPARKKIKKKQREGKHQQDKIDKCYSEIDEIEDTVKNGFKRDYIPLKKEVKQLELLVEYLRLNRKDLIEKKEKLMLEYNISSETERPVAGDDNDQEQQQTLSPQEGGTTTAVSDSNTLTNPLSAEAASSSDPSSKSASSSHHADPNSNQELAPPPPPQRILSAGLFDDQDDLDFVRICNFGFAPSISHPLVRMFVEEGKSENNEDPFSFFEKTQHEGFLGTEAALQRIHDICQDAAKS